MTAIGDARGDGEDWRRIAGLEQVDRHGSGGVLAAQRIGRFARPASFAAAGLTTSTYWLG